MDFCGEGSVTVKAWNAEELARERVRLWYVAATGARDLLILPRHSSALNDGAFANIVDFDLPSLVTIDPEALGDPMPTPENRQTTTRFAEKAGDIVRSHHKIEWRQPSRSEAAAPAQIEIFGSTESAVAARPGEPFCTSSWKRC